MRLKFVNRIKELNELDVLNKKKGLVVFYGRRRVGKTRIITTWLKKNKGWYTQAIEGAKALQLEQIYQDLRPNLSISIVPKNWSELFEILEIHDGPITLCIDEFPYLVASSPELPSIMQKWLDSTNRVDIFLILTGSSQHMMHHHFLNPTSALFGRAQKVIKIRPMDYKHFCQSLGFLVNDPISFVKFSLVGGIPKYWEFVTPNIDVVELAELLYFEFAPYMENEPRRVLIDENINGLSPLNILETIGRGAEKTSEIANKLGTVQTNLSKTMQILLDGSIITRDIPFGETIRSTKKFLYRIEDPVFQFWFKVYSPHRSRWQTYSKQIKNNLINEHASIVFENTARMHLNARRYWHKDIEFDCVQIQNNKVTISEVKWKKLKSSDIKKLTQKIRTNWDRCPLSKKFSDLDIKIIDQQFLSEI
ncbi:MAG: ATP-binding protein [Bacteriovoracaceae bacterium]|nr:ATP-binding protein [Bacteriovoracaceae bacterium]